MTILPLRSERARTLVGRFQGLRALVVGDVMLDRFIVGDVTRMSAEAPVPVVRFRSEHVRLGGAANVAHNLAALGAHVTLVGMVGADQAAGRLRARLSDAGISDDGLIDNPARPTVEKVRIVTSRNQQVARVDYEEDGDAEGELENRIVRTIERVGSEAAVLVASDYLKGMITKAVFNALLSLKAGGAPLLVDPKIPHLDCYAGATIATPNQQEAETATHRRIRSDDDARDAASAFRTRTGCEAALVTRGEHGMWLSSVEAEGAIPSVAREVSDVTGAGDTVIATLGLALAARATLTEAAILANHAAGVSVGKFGPATVSPEELLAKI